MHNANTPHETIRHGETMTPTLDYANTMLDIYLNDDDCQPEAIQHYLELRMSEMVKMDRERELVRMMEEDDEQ